MAYEEVRSGLKTTSAILSPGRRQFYRVISLMMQMRESSSRGRSIAIWENKRKSHRNLRDYLTSHWTRHRDRLFPLLAQWSRGISALQSSHRIHPSRRFPQTPHRLCRKLPFLLLLKAEILTRAIRVQRTRGNELPLPKHNNNYTVFTATEQQQQSARNAGKEPRDLLAKKHKHSIRTEARTKSLSSCNLFSGNQDHQNTICELALLKVLLLNKQLQELHWKHLLLNNQEENSFCSRHYCHWQRHSDRRGTTVVNRRRKSAVGQSAGGTGIDPEVLYKVARNASRRPLRCHLLQQSATLIYPPVL